LVLPCRQYAAVRKNSIDRHICENRFSQVGDLERAPSTRCWRFQCCAIDSYTVISFDPEPARQLRPNPCYYAFAPHPSACCLRLVSIYPYAHSPGRYWDPKHRAICDNTAFSFDPERAWQLHSNPCHHTFVQHPSVCCLRILSIYPYVHSLGRYWGPQKHVICSNTVISFDPEPAR
jgi:hypothetical protein